MSEKIYTIEDLINQLGVEYEIGVPVQGHIYNQIIDGAKKGTLTIRSAASGVGKTRNAVADACYLAYPFRYNNATCEWEQKGNNEKVLFIVTEQRFKEVRTMILAYLTDINATRFKYADFSDRERAVITQATALIKKYSSNLILVKMPNPTIETVKSIVRENCIIYDIGYVFYDYIFIGPSLLNEFKGFALRNDEVLLMFATALKDLAVELDVAMLATVANMAKQVLSDTCNKCVMSKYYAADCLKKIYSGIYIEDLKDTIMANQYADSASKYMNQRWP